MSDWRSAYHTKSLTLQLARYAVKRKIEENGGKVGNYTSEQITNLVNTLLENDPWYKEQAERVITALDEKLQSCKVTSP